jgi:hypothetical protein
MAPTAAGAANGASLPVPAAVWPQSPIVLVSDSGSLLRAANLMDEGQFAAALDRIDPVPQSLPAGSRGQVARPRRAALTMKAGLVTDALSRSATGGAKAANVHLFGSR